MAEFVSKNGLWVRYCSGAVKGISVVSLCSFVTYGELFNQSIAIFVEFNYFVFMEEIAVNYYPVAVCVLSHDLSHSDLFLSHSGAFWAVRRRFRATITLLEGPSCRPKRPAGYPQQYRREGVSLLKRRCRWLATPRAAAALVPPLSSSEKLSKSEEVCLELHAETRLSVSRVNASYDT